MELTIFSSLWKIIVFLVGFRILDLNINIKYSNNFYWCICVVYVCLCISESKTNWTRQDEDSHEVRQAGSVSELLHKSKAAVLKGTPNFWLQVTFNKMGSGFIIVWYEL